MKRPRAALYSPYLNIMGGGEKHILSILSVLEKNGFDCTIFWDDDLTQKIAETFNLNFSRLSFAPNIFKAKGIISKSHELSSFDVFLYVTDGSYFFSTAKKNFVFCMVPQKNLYRLTPLNKLKTWNYRFIANSNFTQKWLKRWGITANVIYPYLNEGFLGMNPERLPKEKILLSVGRFFSHLHAKNQAVIVDFFKNKIHNDAFFKGYKLVLVGAADENNRPYVESLKNLIRETPAIELDTNVSYDELKAWYKKARIYLHFTGYGVDAEAHPEMVEHLGITPLEAMASGCLTFAYDAGGPAETIIDGKTGFLFKSTTELIELIKTLIKDKTAQTAVIRNAFLYVTDHFSLPVFEKRVKEVVL
ncbi:glycosyltransferase family 4 protein [Candidatus Roizmanbacteria bacterium]|nr:glycosyltransferase family 4 protein [Candidatus Roizmanbacteria bacterium]